VAEAGGPLTLRLAWSIQQVPGQDYIARTCLKNKKQNKTKKKKKKKKRKEGKRKEKKR
jgi:hypothetical protein